MNELAKENNEATMTLKEITDLLNVEHNKAMRVVTKMAQDFGFGTVAKIATVYNDRGQTVNTYKLDKRQSMAVSARLNISLLMRIIDRWQQLESTQPQFTMPASFAEALRLSADLQENLDGANAKIEQDAPKVEFAMAVRNMQGACAVSDFAKSISLGRNTLFKMMRDDGLLMRNNMPYQNRIDQGIFQVVEQIPFTDSEGKTHPAFTTFVTGKGQVFLEKKYRKQVDA